MDSSTVEVCLTWIKLLKYAKQPFLDTKVALVSYNYFCVLWLSGFICSNLLIYIGGLKLFTKIFSWWCPKPAPLLPMLKNVLRGGGNLCFQMAEKTDEHITMFDVPHTQTHTPHETGWCWPTCRDERQRSQRCVFQSQRNRRSPVGSPAPGSACRDTWTKD